MSKRIFAEVFQQTYTYVPRGNFELSLHAQTLYIDETKIPLLSIVHHIISQINSGYFIREIFGTDKPAHQKKSHFQEASLAVHYSLLMVLLLTTKYNTNYNKMNCAKAHRYLNILHR